MIATLDYAGFPHLFTRIIEYCDVNTQCTLRHLSSSARDDVDRYHVRLIYVIGYLGLEGALRWVTPLRDPMSLHRDVHTIRAPLLGTGPLKGEDQERIVPWALRNTRHVAIREIDLLIGYDSEASQSRLSLLGPRCNELTLAYNLINLSADPYRVLHVPESVRHIGVLLTVPGGPAAEYRLGNIGITHSCAKVTVEVEEDSDLCEGLGTILRLVNAGMEELVLVVHEPSVVAPFLRFISGRYLNPRLRIDVRIVQKADLKSLRRQWGEIIEADVDVQQYATEL